MRCQTITILNRLGLHARAAAKFVSLASEFESEITLTRDGKQVNGKSIMGIMVLAAGQHVVLELRIDGADEEQAMAKLNALVSERFGEDE